MKKLLLIIGLVIALSGCRHIEPVHTTTFVAPPSVLVGENEPVAPPDKQKYVNASVDEQKQMLVNYANAQTLVLANCNVDKRSLQKWITEQKAIYEKDKK